MQSFPSLDVHKGSTRPHTKSLGNSDSRTSLAEQFTNSKRSSESPNRAIKSHKSSPALSRTISLVHRQHSPKMYNSNSNSNNTNHTNNYNNNNNTPSSAFSPTSSTVSYHNGFSDQLEPDTSKIKSRGSVCSFDCNNSTQSRISLVVRKSADHIIAVSSGIGKPRDRTTLKGVLDRLVIGLNGKIFIYLTIYLSLIYIHIHIAS
ncbi:hypothetical protein J3Q64DRAFT_1749942 [Phycomyces blakesleeanus]|uniref:Uncharacterized protein n=1 Tax=Phycomyces blakesleeanus TaxID=4837 RepID=A0ABR3AVE2_PHYBL